MDTTPRTGKAPIPVQPGDRMFYALQPDITGGGPGHGTVIENEKALLTPPARIIRPPQGGIPPLSETPVLRNGTGRKKLPRDLEGGFSGYWLVSERLKAVFEAVDPKGFQFAACHYVMPDGTPGPQYYLCEVLRLLPALDRERSEYRVKIEHDHRTGEDVELLSFTGGARLIFKPEIVGDAHIFRMAERPSLIICDDTMRDAVRRAGIGVKASSDGVRFREATHY